ncbi:3-hydroxyacyl-CoA dehydrogenase family protein [Neobacillus sp. YX16]|uniref:3-hydroxyacyl-CoA dehydrogenase family protein n=1 Tax=Neobacillus sp. YX16 TaxID=3047874 RepID=UPI0024C23793|nr:3-hydroxyacyl-CoA dehydrogenase family protein [Neobacillus sp. YX16]WHZ00890.1 3-hydroxyacyl-CoA dehydrogenase family protein [Neobacillus sp. YX16]
MVNKKVGVVGCGTMGSGIAIVMARAGYKTIVQDLDDSKIDAGYKRINSFFEGGVKRNKLTKAQMVDYMGNIQMTTKLQDLQDCDYVVEAVFEDVDIKQSLFKNLNNICKPETIFISNTSTLSVTAMAHNTGREDKVIGVHFCNPAPLMKLVEISKALQTSEETYESVVSFSKSIGKEVVTTNDTPGFLVNLFLVPFENDCVRALEQGLGTPEEIDKVIKTGFGYPMGTFELLDIVGLDIHYEVSMSLYRQLKDARFAPPPLITKMIKAGYLGRKTGRGFYQYEKVGVFGS